MADGKLEHDWNLVSHTMAHLSSLKGLKHSPSDLNPLKQARPARETAPIEALKTVMIDKKPLNI